MKTRKQVLSVALLLIMNLLLLWMPVAAGGPVTTFSGVVTGGWFDASQAVVTPLSGGRMLWESCFIRDSLYETNDDRVNGVQVAPLNAVEHPGGNWVIWGTVMGPARLPKWKLEGGLARDNEVQRRRDQRCHSRRGIRGHGRSGGPAYAQGVHDQSWLGHRLGFHPRAAHPVSAESPYRIPTRPNSYACRSGLGAVTLRALHQILPTSVTLFSFTGWAGKSAFPTQPQVGDDTYGRRCKRSIALHGRSRVKDRSRSQEEMPRRPSGTEAIASHLRLQESGPHS